MQGLIPNALRKQCDRVKEWPKESGLSSGVKTIGDYHDCYKSAMARAVEQRKSRFMAIKTFPATIETGWLDAETCLPIIARKMCGDDPNRFDLGYINENGEFTLAMTLTPALEMAPKCERYTFEPLDATNANVPAGTTFGDLLSLVQAADGGAQRYPTFGDVDATTDTVIKFDIVGEGRADILLVDGNEHNSVSYVHDPEFPEVFPAQTPVEIPEGCNLTITLCVQQCRDKAGNVV